MNTAAKLTRLLRSWDAKRWALAIVLFAFLLRLANLLFYAQSPLFHWPTSDEAEHFRISAHLAAGDWLGLEWGTYHRPQFFAYINALAFAIFGTDFLVTHGLILLSDTLAVLFWFAAARRCFSRQAAVLGALFIAVYWPLIHFSGTGYMESFAMMLFAGMLYFLFVHAWRAQRGDPSFWPPLIASGVFAACGILTRPTLMIVMPGIGIGLLLLHWRLHKNWGKAFIPPAVYTVLVASLFSVNAIRHLVYFDLWAPTGTNGSFAFHMANNNDGWGWDVSSPGIEFRVYQMMPIIEGGLETLDRQVITDWWSARNSQYLSEAPGHFFTHLGWKALMMVNAYEVHCTQNFQHLRNLSPITGWFPGFLLFVPLGFAGAALLISRSMTFFRGGGSLTAQEWNRLILVWFALSYLAGVALFLAISRHRIPAIPPLLLIAGWAAWEAIRHLHAQRWRPVAPLAAAWLGFLILALLPIVPGHYPLHERWWTQINLGVARRALGQNEAAILDFQAAAEIQPEKLESWLQLGISHQREGNPEAAVDAYKQLLMRFRQQYPEYYMIEAEIFERIIASQIEAGDREGAIRSANTLVRIVDNEATRALLQRAEEMPSQAPE